MLTLIRPLRKYVPSACIKTLPLHKIDLHWKLRVIGGIHHHHQQYQQCQQLQLPSSALDGCQQKLLLFPSALKTFGWQSIHTTGTLWSEVTVKVPAFAESISEGDVKFTCKVGDSFAADDAVMEIETDKTTMPVPAPFAGTLTAIMVKDGDTVKPGQDLFKMKPGAAPAGAPAPAPAPPKPAAAAPPPAPTPAPAPVAAAPPPPPKGGGGPPVVVKVPAFAESISEGDVKFTCKVGDSFAADDAVMEIETDKTTMPVPAPFAGTLTKIMVKDGDSVKPGQDLFEIQPGAAPAKAAAAPVAAAPAPAPAPAPTPVVAPVAAAPKPAAPPAAAPKGAPPEHQIKGTRSEQRVKMNRMRLKIAARLKEAQNTCAMLTTFNEVDMSFSMEFRKANQDAFTKKHGVKLGFMSIFSKASAAALQDQPVVNAVIEGQETIYRDYIDISMAVATPRGLVVPVIRNVEAMAYVDIEKALADLAKRAKADAITVKDMEGGTFTISNGGVFGSLIGTPIINPPQSAILGMHGIVDRPIAVKGEVKIRPMMYLALTYDHRLIDGREAVLFLRKIKSFVESPSELAMYL